MSRGRQLGRLKLRPLAPQVASKYLLAWHPRDLAQNPAAFPQLTSVVLFENERPLEVEIGAGSGEFLCGLAAENPATNYLAIEVSRRAAHKAVLVAAERELDNLKVLLADFKLLTPLIASASWSRVYLHFPDPPHKHEDEKRIIFDAMFLDLVQRALTADGELSVVSDHAEFFMRMLELAEGDGRFAKMHEGRYLDGFEPGVKSRFQQIWERKGRVPRQFILRKL